MKTARFPRPAPRQSRAHPSACPAARAYRGRHAPTPEQLDAACALVPDSLPQEDFCVYVAPRGLVGELCHELGERVLAVRGRLLLARGKPVPAFWAQNIWLRPQWLRVASINDAARQLRGLGRRWHVHPLDLHRRAALIEQALPRVRNIPLEFGAPLPASCTQVLGAWTLWDTDSILASPETSSPFPDGQVDFVENRLEPPGRAYLKLWEVFTLLGRRPAPDDLCLDLGAAPGGWSWVLGRLGARVFSVDKAPLAPQVAALPTVNPCHGSGFSLEPRHVGRVDWLFSDMICYPERLWGLVSRWLEADCCPRFVCTLKFQSSGDAAARLAVARAFAAVPHSRVLHLSCNKHELTWVRLAP